MHPKQEPGLVISLIPVLLLIGFLSFGIIGLGQEAHIPLILGTAAAGLVSRYLGNPWEEILEAMVEGIRLALGAVLILMVIGVMIGTWIAGGIVPTMIHYGLTLLSPSIFLAATMLICSVVSLGTGSSWSTAGTVGIALLAVGQGLGLSAPLVAGAIISGAYFGDKMSPLSDTTNLAPAVAGMDLFTHIRHMVYTTGPSYLIAFSLYLVLGLHGGGGTQTPQTLASLQGTLQQTFWIHPVLLLAPLLVILMVIRKVPALPALLAGGLLGAMAALWAQGRTLAEVVTAAHQGYVSHTGQAMVDELLSKGGLSSMMNTVALILCALSFGGIMERSGMLASLARALLRRARSTGSLVAATLGSCIAMNLVAAEQYMAIVIPGRMFRQAYHDRGLHPKNLSRCLEDSATLTSPLIPWNSCGAFMAATLGISPWLYLPFAFLNLINPLVSLFYGITGWTMAPLQETGTADPQARTPDAAASAATDTP